jgi:NTP pyrophosphatase (non-canonical NTP hydrolase)
MTPQAAAQSGGGGGAESSSVSDVSLEDLARRLRAFREDRDWDRFHTPRNLAVSIAVESGELLEHFQWVDDEAVSEYVDKRRADIAEEIADVAIYLVQLADTLDLSLSDAISTKIELNDQRYPVELARGNAAKHTELHGPRGAKRGSRSKE